MSTKKGRFTLDSVEPVQYLPDLPKIVEMWLNRDGLDKITVDGYRTKLSYLIQWYGDSHELKPSDLVKFTAWLRESGQSDNHIFDIIRRSKQFFSWLHSQGITPDYNVSTWFRNVTVEREIRTLATLADVATLMHSAGASDFPERNQALIAVMLGTGIRRAECAGLKIEDITIYSDSSGVLIVREPKKTSKGKNQRMAAFDSFSGQYIRVWLDKLGKRTGWLWKSYSPLSKEDDHLTPVSIYRIVNTLIEDAGLSGVIIGCHDLRRLFITHFRRTRRGAGYDHLLSLQVGHSSVAMTDHYDKATIGDMHEVIVSPLSMIQPRPG